MGIGDWAQSPIPNPQSPKVIKTNTLYEKRLVVLISGISKRYNMKSFTALFICAITLVSFANAISMKKVDHLFTATDAQSKLTQILLQLSDSNSTEVTTPQQMVDAIKSMLHAQQEDQRLHEETHKTMMASCKEEDEFRAAEVEEANGALERSKEHHGQCQTSLDEATNTLPTLEATHKEYTEELERATKQRAEEHAEFLKRQASFKQAIEVIEDFIPYVENQFKGKFSAYSFIQVSENILKHSIKLGRMSHAIPVLAQIAQIDLSTHNEYSHNPNENAASKLKDALNHLREILNKDNQTNEDDERAAQEKFND